jgi:uncharacterized phage-associated protein
MAVPLDVARYLIYLAAPSDDEDVDALCHLRLQKLLYYVQGWHLAARGKPLFEGRIEAWQHGPVVREIYPIFRILGYQNIPPREGADSGLSQLEKAFVQSVWNEYKKYSATALSEMTHKEQPWRTARGAATPTERCETEITHESMRTFFLPKLDEWLSQEPRIDKAMWARSREAIESGKAHTTREIRGGIHSRGAGSDS